VAEDKARAKAEDKARAKAEAEQAKRVAEAKAKAKVEAAKREAKIRELTVEMVNIPGGSFRMGDLIGEGGDAEKPVHTVTIQAFKLGKYEVTFAQWDACVADGGCGGYTPNDEGWGRDNRPVINVSWKDAQSYIGWLNSKTNGNYRLPTEAEWEYAARAGSTTRYSWGNEIGTGNAACCRYDGKTVEVGSYSANDFGLYGMYGNVWEWTEDCWNNTYAGAPTNGAALKVGQCSGRVFRGGSWVSDPWDLRSANRVWNQPYFRDNLLGFRLARTM